MENYCSEGGAVGLMTQTAPWGPRGLMTQLFREGGTIGLMALIAGSLPSNSLSRAPPAGVQPQLIQGIRRRDGIGEGQETTA